MSVDFVRIAAAVLLGVGLAVLVVSDTSARDDVPADVAAMENPETLEPAEVRYYTRQFKAKCARCHGKDGTGAGAEARNQPVPPADFTDKAFMATRSDGQLYYQILMGGGERCAMPAFGPGSAHNWNDAKIWNMVAFVRRFAEPASEPAP
jgi:mono/diheme cytochrome c family protein